MLASLKMAGRKGGGRRAESEPGSKLVRVHADVAEMISWITRLEGMSATSLLDPLIRPQITARYEVLRKDIEAIKRLESKYKGDPKAG
jgi:hypothetical protein